MWGLLALPGGVWAHSDPAMIRAASPFDHAKMKKKMHCELKRHLHAKQPICPHKLPGRNPEKQLRTDCGGSSAGAKVQVPVSKSFMLFPSVGRASSAVNSLKLKPRRVPPRSPLPGSLDRPPQQI